MYQCAVSRAISVLLRAAMPAIVTRNLARAHRDYICVSNVQSKKKTTLTTCRRVIMPPARRWHTTVCQSMSCASIFFFFFLNRETNPPLLISAWGPVISKGSSHPPPGSCLQLLSRIGCSALLPQLFADFRLLCPHGNHSICNRHTVPLCLLVRRSSHSTF